MANKQNYNKITAFNGCGKKERTETNYACVLMNLIFFTNLSLILSFSEFFKRKSYTFEY